MTHSNILLLRRTAVVQQTYRQNVCPMNPLCPSQKLSKDEVEQGLSNIIFDGITTHAFATLTGNFLIAFALELGASNIVIGLLAAIPPLAETCPDPCGWAYREANGVS